MSNPKILDLDAVVQESLIIRLKGKDHELKHATLEDFLANAKDLEKLGRAPNLDEEMQTTISMLKRALPSLSIEDINGLKMAELNALVKFVHAANSQDDQAEEAKKAVNENPTIAGQA